MAKLEIGLYVSAVEGHHVSRYGTQTLIGATVDLEHPGNLRFDLEAVVAIPLTEYLTYKREYDRLVADGALKTRTAEEYEAFQTARAAAIDSAAAEAKEQARAQAPEAPADPNLEEVVIDDALPDERGA